MTDAAELLDGDSYYQDPVGFFARVAIARALAGAPQIVFADEPTGNPDSATGAAILDLLTGLSQAGTTIVVVTHDPATAARMNRQVRMLDGRIISDTGGLS